VAAPDIFSRLRSLFCADPADGDYIIRATDGDTVLFPHSAAGGPASTIVDNGYGTFTHDDGDGNETDINICGMIAACSVGALSDVDMATVPPVNGDYVRFDGTNWVPVKKFFGYAAVKAGNSTLGASTIVIDVSAPTLIGANPGGLTWTGANVRSVALQRNVGGTKIVMADYEVSGSTVTVHLASKETVPGGHAVNILLIQ